MTRLSPELTGFLERHLDSFEKLALMHQLWSARKPVLRSELQLSLRLDGMVMRSTLAELGEEKLVVETDDGLALSLGPRALEDTFESVMQLYGEDRLAILPVLSEIAMKRIRSLAARRFADAFVLTRKKPRGEDG